MAGFMANYLWEHAHVFLYAHYQGGAISEFILVRATLFDALYCMIGGILFLSVPTLRKRSWLLLPIGFMVAIFIEWYALGTGRWAYNGLMPIIPGLHVGLTPAIQLGLISYGMTNVYAMYAKI